LSSWCTFVQSGTGFVEPSWNPACVNSRRSSAASVISGEIGQVIPIGAVHVLGHGRFADAGCLAHLTDAEPQLMRQPQHLSNLPHRHFIPAIGRPCCS
jgi:hypothetical protein